MDAFQTRAARAPGILLAAILHIERTLQDRINEVKNKIAEHYEQCRAELGEIAETFGIETDELFTLAGVPLPEENTRRRPKNAAKKK